MRRNHSPRTMTLSIATIIAGMLVTSAASASGGTPPICVPSPEVCDGIDNDCDGTIDNGNPGGTVPCITGLLGACGLGTLTCVEGSLQCVPELEPGQVTEVCDGIDNDCDGVPDDGFSVGATCTVGQGACLTYGWRVCNSTGSATLCNATPGPMTPEVCDGIDNDCDGTIDNGTPGSGEACDTGLAGSCAIGHTACDLGVMSCVADAIPGGAEEICDGVDNDCDGAIDDGDPGGGVACDSGLPGACQAGLTHCHSGVLACAPLVQTGAQQEACDGIDNDCDGVVDDGCEGSGGAGGSSGSSGSGGSGPSGGDGGDGGASAGCADDTDCADGFACEIDSTGFGLCVPVAEHEDKPYGSSGACACTTGAGADGPIDLLYGALFAATAIAASSRRRRPRRSR